MGGGKISARGGFVDGHGRLGQPSEPRGEELLRGRGSLRALVLGDGDGRFLERLLAVQPTIQVDYVDSSAKMLALARERVEVGHGDAEAGRGAVFHMADARRWLPAGENRYDLICTHFFLDCLTDGEVEALVCRLAPFVEGKGVWIVSEFHQPDRGLAAWRARLWIGGLYRLFGWATGLRVRRLPDYRAVLARHGFRLEREVRAEWGLLVSEWWER